MMDSNRSNAVAERLALRTNIRKPNVVILVQATSKSVS